MSFLFLQALSMFFLICFLMPFVYADESGKLKIETVYKPTVCSQKAFPGMILKFLYTGTLDDGTVFSESRDPRNPLEFKLGEGKVVKGFEKGIFGMCLKEVRKLVIHSDLAYKDQPYDLIPAHSTLHYEVELIDIDDSEASESLSHQTFLKIDTDRDQVLSQDEVSAYIRIQEANQNQQLASEFEHNNMIADIFNSEDLDKDGSISKEEFFKMQHEEL